MGGPQISNKKVSVVEHGISYEYEIATFKIDHGATPGLIRRNLQTGKTQRIIGDSRGGLCRNDPTSIESIATDGQDVYLLFRGKGFGGLVGKVGVALEFNTGHGIKDW